MKPDGTFFSFFTADYSQMSMDSGFLLMEQNTKRQTKKTLEIDEIIIHCRDVLQKTKKKQNNNDENNNNRTTNSLNQGCCIIILCVSNKQKLAR